MKILLVENDAESAHIMELMLKSEQHNVYLTATGEEAIDLATTYDYDAISLDLHLQDMSGFSALKTLRMRKVRAPILVIGLGLEFSDRHEVAAKALTLGADDYLAKPIHKDEYIARLESIARRSRGHATPLVTVGDFVLDLDKKEITLNGERVHLTRSEFGIIELLALRKDQVVTKEMFLTHLYDGMDEPEIKIVDVFVCRVRNKLKAVSGGDHFIETIWGRGYILRERGGCPEPPKHRPLGATREFMDHVEALARGSAA